MRRRAYREQPARCVCQGGKDQAQEHARPGAGAADHGDPFGHRGGCHHSELQLTTARRPAQPTMERVVL